MTRTRPYLIAFAAGALFAGSSLPALAAGMDRQDRRGDHSQTQSRGGHERGSIQRSVRQAPSAGARSSNRASQVRSHTPSPRASSPRPSARPHTVSQSRPVAQTRPSGSFNNPPRTSPGRLSGGPSRPSSHNSSGSARPAVVTQNMNLQNRTFRDSGPRSGGHNSPGRPSTPPRHDGGNDHNYGGNGGRGDHDGHNGNGGYDGHNGGYSGGHNGGYSGGHDRNDRYGHDNRYGHNGSHYSGSRNRYGSSYYGRSRYYGRNNVGFSLNFVFPSANHYSSQYGYFSPVRYWCPLHGFYHDGYYAPYRYDSHRSYVYYGYDDYNNGYRSYAQNCEYRYVRTRYDWDREEVCYDGRGRIYVRY